MKNYVYKYLLLVWVVFFTLTELNAQNNGAYTIPFPNKRLPLPAQFDQASSAIELLNFSFPQSSYPNINFDLIIENESIGAKHSTYQIKYKDYPMVQALVKIHRSKRDGKIILLQSNLPDEEVWHTLKTTPSPFTYNGVYLYLDGYFELCEKQTINIEAKDEYAERFVLKDQSYFENDLKFNADTIAYAKVFYPDPLTTANQSYGGLYQDAFTKDTAGILIQNINNPGGTTVTVNGTNYNFDGQLFNVPTESYLNEFSASVLHQVFENIFLDGQGLVLGFNTDITEDLASYVTQIVYSDYNYPSLENEQVWKSFQLEYSGGMFNLSNAAFIISEFSSPSTNPAFSVSDSFDFNRSEIQFEDVNAFYHLNNFKTHWESLGFTGLADQVILVDAHGNNGADNSFFTPTSPPKLVFGQGGVDDAEDADVIVHEYGHAISNFASPGTNSGNQRRALDEGFGDYLATSYSKLFSNFNSGSVFSWDGHNEFWAGRFSNLSKTKLDIDVNQTIYYNGEIWSATLMDLHAEIGGTDCDKLAIEVMYYNMPNTSLSEAALNLFLADTSIFNGNYTCQIFDVLKARKFVGGTCTDITLGIQNSYDDGKIQLLNSYGFAYNNENLILSCTDCNYSNSTVSIIDINGKVIQEIELSSSYQELSAKDLAPGIYFIELNTSNEPYRFKVMKY